MQTCETCRHWVRDAKLLSRDEFATGYGLCGPACNPQISSREPDMGAYTQAAHGSDAFFTTRADFGCIAHEPRE